MRCLLYVRNLTLHNMLVFTRQTASSLITCLLIKTTRSRLLFAVQKVGNAIDHCLLSMVSLVDCQCFAIKQTFLSILVSSSDCAACNEHLPGSARLTSMLTDLLFQLCLTTRCSETASLHTHNRELASAILHAICFCRLFRGDLCEFCK